MIALPIQCQAVTLISVDSSSLDPKKNDLQGSFFGIFLPIVRLDHRRTRDGRISARRPSDRSWRRLQTALPLTLPPKTVTPLMQKVMEIVRRTAFARLPMPTNIELGEMLGRCRQSIAKAFDRLVALGRLRVDTRQGHRRVYVVSKRCITGWGEHRLGHAPFSKRPKGSEPPPAESLPPPRYGRAEGFGFLGIPQLQDYSYRRIVMAPEPSCSPARECQFIVNTDTYSVQFCKAPSAAGKSWCAHHYGIVYSKK